MTKLFVDLLRVSLVTVVVFMLGVANVIQIVLGLLDVSGVHLFSNQTAYVSLLTVAAVLTFAVLWRYGRSDRGASLREDWQNLKMKWMLRGI